jgi:putative ABC transport system permease protein
MNLQITLAWRYLNGRKLRTFLTTLAVIFGVMVIFGMNIILPTMLQAFQANIMAAGGKVDVSITHQSGDGFSVDVPHQLDGITGIRAYSASLERTINLPADFLDGNPARPDRISALSLVGVDPGAARALHVYLAQPPGRFLQAGDTNATVISQTLADAYGVKLGGDIKVLSVNGTTTLVVVGILPPPNLPGNEEVFVSLARAQAMTGLAGQVNTIEVALSSTDETLRNQTVAAIKSALGSAYQVGVFQTDSELFASIQLGQAAFNMFGVLALFMGGFIIFNTFRTVVTERRRDIGMLRALGARRSTITGMILVEGLLQGLIGSAVGLLLGYLFGAVIVRFIEQPINAFINVKLGTPVFSASLAVTSALLGVGITVLAGLIPAHNASRLTPMDALRPSVAEAEYKRRAGAGFIAGLVMICLALLALASGNMGLISFGCLLFLLGLILAAPALLRPIAFVFGRVMALLYARQGTADLAQGNLTRQPARVAITASASMIGLAVIVALGGMSTSLNGMMVSTLHKSLGSDYLFVPPSVSVWNSDIGAGPEFANKLMAIPGVGDITTLRFSSSQAGGQSVSLLGINPVTFPKVSGLDFKQGNESAYAALADGRNMIVNGAFVAEIKAGVGDTVKLATPQGIQAYKIVALATDLLNAKVVTAFISQANLAADFGRSDDVFLQLNLKPGVKMVDVDAQVKAVAADYPQFTVIAGKSYSDQMMQLLRTVFAGLYFLLAFLALPSLIAMLNTLAISVLERTREIGMIRAVGGTRRQVRRMVVAEALLLACIGTAFGLLSGIYLGYVIVRALGTLFPMQYSFPFAGILAGIAIGLLFGALAAVIPARQAARLQVVEALRYE